MGVKFFVDRPSILEGFIPKWIFSARSNAGGGPAGHFRSIAMDDRYQSLIFKQYSDINTPNSN
jgi:hypothetical protein